MIVALSAGGDLAAWLPAVRAWDLVIFRQEPPGVTLEPTRTALHEALPDAAARCRAAGYLLHVRAHTPSPDQPFTASAHDEREVEARLRAGARWVLWSPFATPTSKPGDRRPTIGFDRFLESARGRPVLALGGVDPPTLARLYARGAAGAAVLGGIAAHGAVAYAAVRDRAAGRPRHGEGSVGSEIVDSGSSLSGSNGNRSS